MPNFKFQISNFKFISGFYLLGIIALFFYSYTQVDLSLTLSRVSIYQTVEKSFQYIGYFNRPLSTYFYIAIIIALFLLYGLLLWLVAKNKITKKQLWILILITVGILTFSYNAFSYDFFNYIFDAKIFTHYHLNPYAYKALDFPGDPMLSFMHWTHRVYPYGPTWLILTVPLSFIGLQYFLPTFFLFKILMAICFLGTILYIGKIMKKISPDAELLALAFFALNPYVLIESMVSAHNDSAMMFFIIASYYFLMNKKYIVTSLLFLLSVGVKFATAVVLPIYFLAVLQPKLKLKNQWEKLFFGSLLLMIIAIFAASYRTTFQPWYMLYLFPFAALLAKKRFIVVAGFVMGFGMLLLYIPYLHEGGYNPPIPDILFGITIGTFIASAIFGSITLLFSKKKTNMVQ